MGKLSGREFRLKILMYGVHENKQYQSVDYLTNKSLRSIQKKPKTKDMI